MARTKIKYRILLIDDDEEMNDQLERLLSGHRVEINNIEVVPEIDRIDILLEKINETTSRWKISDKTLEKIHLLSRYPYYDLIMTDYSLATQEAKDVLWQRKPSQNLSGEAARGLLLTVRDLNLQYEVWQSNATNKKARVNIFSAARRVILRSFVHRLDLDYLGPLVPNRAKATQSAFPNAEIIAIDTRQDFFANDRFYSLYEQPQGRDFYRHIVGTYYLRIVESEILRSLVARIGKSRVRKSVFNIAMFAGFMAVLGGGAQYFADLGLNFLNKGNQMGWVLLVGGFGFLFLGALVLAMSFEWFTRQAIQWIRPEDDIDY